METKDKKEYNRIKKQESRERAKINKKPVNVSPEQNRAAVANHMEGREQLKINTSPELAEQFRNEAKNLKLNFHQYLELLMKKD